MKKTIKGVGEPAVIIAILLEIMITKVTKCNTHLNEQPGSEYPATFKRRRLQSPPRFSQCFQ
ncbi:MAG: hypothetical protein QXG48_03565 [Thermofilaceae archaeon]